MSRLAVRPSFDAGAWLDEALGTDPAPSLLILLGLGDGQVLDVLARRAPDTRVVAIEPDSLAAASFLAGNDRGHWRASGRLLYLADPDYAGADDAWKMFPAEPKNHKVLVTPAVAREQPGAVRAARVLKRIVFAARENAAARKAFAGTYLVNTLRNLPALVSEGDVASLGELFHNRPAVVVAAGPSLDAKLEAIRALDGQVVIIAVDTALRPLRAAGIRPHMVVAVDPSEMNAGHLIGAGDTSGTWLVAEGSLDPRVFPEFAGRAFSFKVSDHHPWPWLRAHGFDRGTLRAWGSVLTTAFDLACHVGCDPIIFVGADLAYTDGLPYCRHTIYEPSGDLRSLADRVEAFAGAVRPSTRKEPDVRGATTVSTDYFVQFRDWLVSRAANGTRRVLNATGAGILHGPSISQIDLDELATASIAGRARDVGAQLAAARHKSVCEGKRARLLFERVFAGQDDPAIPMEQWLEFAGDTTSSEQITQCIEGAWRTCPVVTEHPASVFWIPGWTVSFTAAASGGPRPTVQWQASTDDGRSWSDIEDATTPTYTLTLTEAERGKQLRAVFTNVHGSAMTAVASIAVHVDGVVHDFNGDGKPDVLWRNTITGANVIWYLDGVERRGLGVLCTASDQRWTIVGAGHFSADGKPNILWYDRVTGDSFTWCMDGESWVGNEAFDRESDLSWRIVGVADFNGDGKPDILWRNAATGANRVWFMDGVKRMDTGRLDAETDLAWTVAGAADFNGDGQPDILWRNRETGENRVWLLDGVTRTKVQRLGAEPDLAWTIVGTGDFNGCGGPDILWRHSVTGATVVWYMDGVRRTGLGRFKTIPGATCVSSPQELEFRAQMGL